MEDNKIKLRFIDAPRRLFGSGGNLRYVAVADVLALLADAKEGVQEFEKVKGGTPRADDVLDIIYRELAKAVTNVEMR